MLDFNRNLKHQSKDNSVSVNLNMLLDQALSSEKSLEPPRKYLGASRLGVLCSRALQYEYKYSCFGIASIFDPKAIRIFAAGHLFEELAINWLKLAGFELTHFKNECDGHKERMLNNQIWRVV